MQCSAQGYVVVIYTGMGTHLRFSKVCSAGGRLQPGGIATGGWVLGIPAIKILRMSGKMQARLERNPARIFRWIRTGLDFHTKPYTASVDNRF